MYKSLISQIKYDQNPICRIWQQKSPPSTERNFTANSISQSEEDPMGLCCSFKRFFPWIDFFLALHTTRLFKPRRATQSRHSERERGAEPRTDLALGGRPATSAVRPLSLSLTDSLCAWGYTTLQCLNREITILLLWLLWINMIRD